MIDISTEAVTAQKAARFVIDYMERETGVDFGDMIGSQDRDRIIAIAGGCKAMIPKGGE